MAPVTGQEHKGNPLLQAERRNDYRQSVPQLSMQIVSSNGYSASHYLTNESLTGLLLINILETDINFMVPHRDRLMHHMDNR